MFLAPLILMISDCFVQFPKLQFSFHFWGESQCSTVCRPGNQSQTLNIARFEYFLNLSLNYIILIAYLYVILNVTLFLRA